MNCLFSSSLINSNHMTILTWLTLAHHTLSVSQFFYLPHVPPFHHQMRRYELTTRRTVQPRASRLHGNDTNTTGGGHSSTSSASSLMADIRRDMLGDPATAGLSGGVARTTLGSEPRSGFSEIRRDIRSEMATPKQRDIQRDMQGWLLG